MQNRGISTREAAALSTFPDRYTFHGTHSHIARQIGNAVPVELAEAIGRQILSLARHKSPARLLVGTLSRRLLSVAHPGPSSSCTMPLAHAYRAMDIASRSGLHTTGRKQGTRHEIDLEIARLRIEEHVRGSAQP